MRIDDNIRQALNSLKATRSFAEIATAVGSTRSSVTRWANGSAQEIRAEYWNALQPMLISFLPYECIKNNNGVPHYQPESETYETTPEVKQMLELLKLYPPEVQAEKAREMIRKHLLK